MSPRSGPQARRPPIPRELERAVLVEAGHRCAIPTCRQSTLEIVHITPWHQVKEHRFENLIVLCPNCHTRYDKGEIDRKSMRHYKASLSILNSRYGDLERRVLTLFAANPHANQVQVPGDLEILLMYLLNDGLLVRVGPGWRSPAPGVQTQSSIGGVPTEILYRLTPAGREFVSRWVKAEDLP